MDLQMPGTDGFTAIRELARVAPSVRVCVLTVYDDNDSLFAAMRAGAHGYLLKGAEQDKRRSHVRSAPPRRARCSSVRAAPYECCTISALPRPSPPWLGRGSLLEVSVAGGCVNGRSSA
jgi:DNA-binding NtrC family response regulator